MGGYKGKKGIRQEREDGGREERKGSISITFGCSTTDIV